MKANRITSGVAAAARRFLRRIRGDYRRWANAQKSLTQIIPLQSLNRSLFEYDVRFYGEAEAFMPEFPPAEIPRHLALQWLPRVSPPAYAFRLRRASISGSDVVDPENPSRIFVELLDEPFPIEEGRAPLIDFGKRKRDSRRAIARSCEIDGAFIFSNVNWDNYYHFLLDCCLRYADVKESGLLSAHDALMLHSAPNSWQADFLNLLGVEIKNARLLDRGGGSPIVVKDLLIASSSRSRYIVSRRAIGNLRRVLLSSMDCNPLGGKRRLYVTRREATKRRVVNEAQVESLLHGWGFETIQAEALSASEQILMFSEAEWVIGPHGAGLSNILFCKVPRVIEFLPADRWNLGHFAGLAMSLSGEYVPLVTKNLTENYDRALRDGRDDSDYSVDLERLEALLKKRLV